MDKVLIGELIQLAQDGKNTTDLWEDNLMLYMVSSTQRAVIVRMSIVHLFAIPSAIIACLWLAALAMLAVSWLMSATPIFIRSRGWAVLKHRVSD